MITTSLLLALAFTPATAPRIFQCRDARGVASYQDKPCESADGQTVVEAGEQALQRWLEAQRRSEAAQQTTPASRASPAQKPAQPPAPLRPATAQSAREERQLAACSERFLHCARGGERAMDACITALPRCGNGAGACCPAPCIERYRSSRARGEPPSAAVWGALLDPAAPSCAAPP